LTERSSISNKVMISRPGREPLQHTRDEQSRRVAFQRQLRLRHNRSSQSFSGSVKSENATRDCAGACVENRSTSAPSIASANARMAPRHGNFRVFKRLEPGLLCNVLDLAFAPGVTARAAKTRGEYFWTSGSKLARFP